MAVLVCRWVGETRSITQVIPELRVDPHFYLALNQETLVAYGQQKLLAASLPARETSGLVPLRPAMWTCSGRRAWTVGCFVCIFLCPSGPEAPPVQPATRTYPESPQWPRRQHLPYGSLGLTCRPPGSPMADSLCGHQGCYVGWQKTQALRGGWYRGLNVPPLGGGVSARGRAQSWGLPLAFCRVVGLPRAGGRFMGDQAKLGSPSGAGAGQGALGPRQPTLTVRELWGRARWGTRSSQGQSHHPGQGAGPACEGGQGQGQPRGDLGRAWVPHSSHPPGPCWIQLLPRLLLAPVPATQPSPFGSSRPLLKTPLCQEADRKRKGNAWKRFVTRALFPPSAPGHHHPPGFASHKAGAPKN